MARYALVDKDRHIVDCLEADNVVEAVKQSLNYSALGAELFALPLTNKMIVEHIAKCLESIAKIKPERELARLITEFDTAFKAGHLGGLLDWMEGLKSE